MNDEKSTKYPFSITEYYSPGLNSLKRIYTQHPKFNGNTRLIYELLFDHWNAEKGYGWPTIYELARESGLSISCVKTQIRTLLELELIRKEKTSVNGRLNDVYYVLQPVSSIEEFYAKFPDIKAKAEERIERINAEEKKDKLRLGKSRIAGD